MYVIKRIDQGGGYVAIPGSKNSYTKNLRNLRKFNTIEEAERELCVENEIIVSVESLMN